MDGECGVTCHLQCVISSVSVTGLACGGNGKLFLRCHVPAGGGRAIQIDSRATAAPADGGGAAAGVVSWRNVASLSCDGTPACVRELVERRCVVFEVRRRPGTGRRTRALRRILGSELVGRAEVAWSDGGGGDDEAVERQVVLSAPGSGGRAVRGDVPALPVLSVRMTARVSEAAAPAGGRRRVADSAAQRESGWSVGNEAAFALAACAAEGAPESLRG